MDKIKIIKNIINEKLGKSAKVIKQLETTNNDVFVISFDDKEYIFKTYSNQNWPENGKLLYINKMLEEKNISHPKVLAYTRNDEYFKYGYVIEEKIKGNSLLYDEIDMETSLKVYESLAKLISKVHQIKFDGCGYLNDGNLFLYDKLSDYIEDILDENLTLLNEKNLLQFNDINNIIKKISSKFDKFNIEAVLIHGDLSIRNVIYNEQVVLIDWDDAMALPWQSDIARMTFDMKFMYDEKTYYLLRDCFLKAYNPNLDIENFNKFEKLFHIFVAADWLVFCARKGELDNAHSQMLKYMKDLITNVDKI